MSSSDETDDSAGRLQSHALLCRDGVPSEEPSQQLCAIYDAWTWSAEEAIGVQRPYLTGLHGAQPCPPRVFEQGHEVTPILLDPVATCDAEDDIGVGLADLFKGQSPARGARDAKGVDPSSDGHLLRDPVAAVPGGSGHSSMATRGGESSGGALASATHHASRDANRSVARSCCCVACQGS